MKKISVLCVGLFIAFTSFSQFGGTFECPPGAWCHPNGSGLGGVNAAKDDPLLASMTSAADAVGKNLNQKVKDSGSDKGIWGAIVDIIRCSYGTGTAQAADCSTNESLPKKEKLGSIVVQGFKVNGNFSPVYFNGTAYKVTLEKSLSKFKRGDKVDDCGRDFCTYLGYKYYLNKEKTEYAVVLYVTDAKNNIVATPVIVTKGERVYLAELFLPKK